MVTSVVRRVTMLAAENFIDVGKGILLDTVEHIVPQIPCKSGRGKRRKVSGECAEDQRKHTAHQQDPAVVHHRIHAACAVNALVDQLCHQQRYHHFHDNLQHHKQRGKQGKQLEFPNRLH